MKRIFAYSISLIVFLMTSQVNGQDSIKVPLNIRFGFDVVGPLYHMYKAENSTMEGYIAFENSPVRSYVIEGGYQNFSYSQYNYNYTSNGLFLRAGADFNIIKPFQSEGKYFTGVGLRYGISIYNTGVPEFSSDNYWGTGTGSAASEQHLAHFIEADPGIRTQILKFVSIGLSVRLKVLISSGTGKDMKPINIPGFGNGTKRFSPGFNYYISFSIPYKRIYARPVVEEAPEKEESDK
jgi:hypothetical protein